MRGLGIGALVAAIAVASCGGGDDSDSLPNTVQALTTTTAAPGRALADWQAASRGVCEEYNPRVMAAFAEIEAQTPTSYTCRWTCRSAPPKRSEPGSDVVAEAIAHTGLGDESR